MSSYLLTFPILSTYKYFRHLHERETIPRNDIKVKGKPISRRDGKPFPYRINEYPVLGCCLCRYADITFVQAAEIRGIANQQAMTIPQILFQISSRPFFQAGQEESHGCRQCFEVAQLIQPVDQAGCLALPFTDGQDILLRMRQDVFTGFHSDCIDRPGNDVPVYLLDLIRRSDQVC